MIVGPIHLLILQLASLLAERPSQFLPDGTLRPGVRITIPAGEEREILFQPQGVRFLAGRAQIIALSGPIKDEFGQEKEEITIDVDEKSATVPWIHDQKPFRLRMHAITDFTLEAREEGANEPTPLHLRPSPDGDSLPSL